MILTQVRLAFAGLRTRRLATALTVLLAAAAATTIVLVLEVRETGRDPWQRTFAAAHGAHVLANAPTRAVAESSRTLQGVVESDEPVPQTLVELATPQGGERFRVVGWSTVPTVNIPIATAGADRPGDGVVLERSFARARGLEVGSPLVLAGSGGEVRLKVVGTAILPSQSRYPRSNPGVAWVRLPTMERLQPDRSSWRWVTALRVRDPGGAGVVADAILAGAAPGTVEAQTWQEQRDDALKDTAPMQLILSMYSVVLLSVAFAVVGILVGARVLEQSRAIGLLKAVGLTPRQVGAVFVIESAVLGVIATGLGFVAGAVLAPSLSGVMAQTMVGSPTVAADPVHLVVAGLPVLVVLVLSSWLAARRRTRTTVLDALRSAQATPPRRSLLTAATRRLPLGVPVDVGVRAFVAGRARVLLLTAAMSLAGASSVFALSTRAALDAAPSGEVSDVPAELPALVYSLDGVLLVVVISGLVAVALLSVRERLRDFGILKTLGLTPRQVASTLVLPMAVVAGIAGALAVPLGLGLYVVVYAAAGGEGDPVLAPWTWLLPVPLAMVLLVLLATAVPARLVMRAPALAALRPD